MSGWKKTYNLIVNTEKRGREKCWELMENAENSFFLGQTAVFLFDL